MLEKQIEKYLNGLPANIEEEKKSNSLLDIDYISKYPPRKSLRMIIAEQKLPKIIKK